LCYAAKFESEVEFKAQFKLLLAVNDCPKISEDDDALFSRVRRIPWNVVIPPAKQDRYLREKLTTPEVLSAILRWAVQGLREYIAMGEIGTCSSVEASNLQYRSENDQTRDFIDSCLEVHESYRCPAIELRSAYDAWCKRESVKYPISKDKMARRLESIGASPAKGHAGQRYWKGVRVLANEPEEGGQEAYSKNEPTADIEPQEPLFGDYYRGNGKGYA
jgi:putative DNA primase/helicase